MHATMEHQERPRDKMSRCINDVTKRWRLLYWFVWGKCQGTLSIIYFYTVECASCAEALNKPTEVFCMHTSYVSLVTQKMARLSWKHCMCVAELADFICTRSA